MRLECCSRSTTICSVSTKFATKPSSLIPLVRYLVPACLFERLTSRHTLNCEDVVLKTRCPQKPLTTGRTHCLFWTILLKSWTTYLFQRKRLSKFGMDFCLLNWWSWMSSPTFWGNLPLFDETHEFSTFTDSVELTS